MTQGRPAFCIDIDNVIAQSDRVMRQVIADYTGGRVRLRYCDVTDYDYCNCSDVNGNQISRQEWEQVHSLFSEPRYLMRIRPMDGAIEGLCALAAAGTVFLGTSRLNKAEETTRLWLELHGLSFFSLRFLPHRRKHLYFEGLTGVVEDDYDQALMFSQAGTQCFLLEHPWNAGKDKAERLEWRRSWSTLVPSLLKLADAGSHQDKH